MEIYLDLDELALFGVKDFLACENDEREGKLSIEECINLMLAQYDELARRAFAAEAVLETVLSITDQHSRIIGLGKVPSRQEWPTYPEYPNEGHFIDFQKPATT